MGLETDMLKQLDRNTALLTLILAKLEEKRLLSDDEMREIFAKLPIALEEIRDHRLHWVR